MPFQIVRNDITLMQVDAIVNTANPRPLIGAGTDSGIHRAAGPQLLEARRAIGPIAPGTAAITPGFRLAAKYVIHTVGPVWRDGSFGEAEILRSCYDVSLRLALENHCTSIAFPLISAGSYGFPREKALHTAISAFSEFLMGQDMEIFLVVLGADTCRLSEKLFSNVRSYVDENYVQTVLFQEYGPAPLRRRRETADLHRISEAREADCTFSSAPRMSRPARAPVPKAATLKQLLEQTDAGFSETLLKLIDRSGKKDSEVYTKANVSRQHFSKIRNNPAYRPTKATALAFAIALELDLEQTADLIGRAGYALTKSSKFDLIIMYFIQQGNYNIFDINTALFDFDQSLLGA